MEANEEDIVPATRRVTITIARRDLRAVTALGERACRTPKEQMVYLIRQGLELAGAYALIEERNQVTS